MEHTHTSATLHLVQKNQPTCFDSKADVEDLAGLLERGAPAANRVHAPAMLMPSALGYWASYGTCISKGGR